MTSVPIQFVIDVSDVNDIRDNSARDAGLSFNGCKFNKCGLNPSFYSGLEGSGKSTHVFIEVSALLEKASNL
jgi:hypothetical protein